MCGIAGKLFRDSARPVETGLLERMSAILAHRGPDDAGIHQRRSRGSGLASAGHPGSQRRRPPADVEPRRPAVDHLQRRDLQFPAPARRAGAGGRPVPLAERHRGHPGPLRPARAGLSRAPARDVRPGHLGPGGAHAVPGPGPAGEEAALLLPGRRPVRVRLRAEGHPPGSRGRRGAGPRRPASLPHLRVRARSVVGVPRRAEASPRPLPRAPGRAGEPPSVLGAAPHPQAERGRAGADRGAPRPPRRGGPPPSHQRRSRGSLAQRRARLERRGRAHPPRDERADPHLLHRVRPAGLRRDSVRPRGGAASRDRAPRAGGEARRRVRRPAAGVALQRALRRLLRPPFAGALRDGARVRDGRAQRRRRRRGLPRIRPVPGHGRPGPPGLGAAAGPRAGGRGGARAPAGHGQIAHVPDAAVHRRADPGAARPLRDVDDLLREQGQARAVHAGALAGARGHRLARLAGRRVRGVGRHDVRRAHRAHRRPALPARRPAGEDGHRQHGELAGSAVARSWITRSWSSRRRSRST